MFQYDFCTPTESFKAHYSGYLNSDDLYDMDLPLIKGSAHGGTLIFWKKVLAPYVTVILTSSNIILPIILCLPGYPRTADINIYFPQRKLECDFFEELSNLEAVINDLYEKYSNLHILIRGDANSSTPQRPNNNRD